jgi:mannan endo-1,4-beta-mannosidase
MHVTRSALLRGALAVLLPVCARSAAAAGGEFVVRSGDTLMLEGRPFFFTGANAYYLMESAARGDTAAVRGVFAAAAGLGMRVLRTWAFHDSPDSLDPAVLQYRPGAYNATALRALDYVVATANEYGLRLVLPLVNSWDDYGGMNQYARWRAGYPAAAPGQHARHGEAHQRTLVRGARGQSFRAAVTADWGHDDFYRDPLIRSWFRDHMAVITRRVNTRNGVAYRDDPTIMAWELANEPRSMDPSGETVAVWAEEMANELKSLDPAHLVGTGEEGFDVSPAGYDPDAYGGERWLFDGTAGVAFTRNSALQAVDIMGTHLYPEAWNLTPGTGNAWITDHVRIAGNLRKPLLVGEFGVRSLKESVYGSWLSTALYEGAAGALVWQLLNDGRTDPEGFGVHCPAEAGVCETLRRSGEEFAWKSAYGSPALPAAPALRQNYPNPFNGRTTIEYDLPFDAQVTLAVYDATGELVVRLVDGWQRAGVRRELFETVATRLGRLPLASGVYWYRLDARGAGGATHTESHKLVLLK